MKHKHTWHLVCSDAMGEFEKQPGQGIVFSCHGVVECCDKCKTYRIVPNDPNLYPVEVETA